jgi:hypothetical protein
MRLAKESSTGAKTTPRRRIFDRKKSGKKSNPAFDGRGVAGLARYDGGIFVNRKTEIKRKKTIDVFAVLC